MLGRGRWYNCPNLVSATLEGDEGGHEGGDRSGYCGDRCRNRGCHHVERAAPLHLGVRCEVVERSGLLAHLLRKLRKRHVRGLFCHCQPSVSQRLSSSGCDLRRTAPQKWQPLVMRTRDLTSRADPG